MVSYGKKKTKKKKHLIRPQKLQVLQSNLSLTNKVHKDASATNPLIEFTALHLDAEA